MQIYVKNNIKMFFLNNPAIFFYIKTQIEQYVVKHIFFNALNNSEIEYL